MSLQNKILSLVAGIDDPATRLEIARTILFLYEVYRTGRASDEDITKALYDVALTIIKFREPYLPDEEKREKAGKIADELFELFRMESLFKTTLRRIGTPTF
ncbi:hypothetical protein DRN86_00035 [Candidatus Geothermarchaeota archaeon]|nr:MAG: hypothetical protein DRN86_00035 [Candidatus Geothermarchaeota archaeon]